MNFFQLLFKIDDLFCVWRFSIASRHLAYDLLGLLICRFEFKRHIFIFTYICKWFRDFFLLCLFYLFINYRYILYLSFFAGIGRYYPCHFYKGSNNFTPHLEKNRAYYIKYVYSELLLKPSIFTVNIFTNKKQLQLYLARLLGQYYS